MLDYKHKQHRHGRPQTFFPRVGKVDIFLYISGCGRYNASRHSHNALPFLHHKENDPCYANSPKNACASLAAVLLFTLYKTRCQQYFFSVFTPYKCFFPHCDLLLSAVIVSLHYLAQMQWRF